MDGLYRYGCIRKDGDGKWYLFETYTADVTTYEYGNLEQLIRMSVLFLERASIQNNDTIATFFTRYFQIYLTQYCKFITSYELPYCIIIHRKQNQEDRGGNCPHKIQDVGALPPPPLNVYGSSSAIRNHNSLKGTCHRQRKP